MSTSSGGYLHGESDHWGADCALEARPEAGETVIRRITGKCPVCKHPISKDILPLSTGAYLVPTDAPPPPPPDPLTYLVTCNCVYGHEGAPEGVRGCGAQGAVRVILGTDGVAQVEYVQPPVQDRDADEWIERAEHQQLPRLREAAGQWATMLGVVTGFVTVGTIFDFSKKDLGLSGRAWVAYLVFAGLALAAAVLAVISASKAAGLRQLDQIPADLDGRVQRLREAVTFCRSRLAWSRLLALSSVVLLVIALAVRFSV